MTNFETDELIRTLKEQERPMFQRGNKRHFVWLKIRFKARETTITLNGQWTFKKSA